MENRISFRSKFGWITVIEINDKIISIDFLKSTNKGKSIQLNKLKKNLNNFFLKKIKKINVNIHLEGSSRQKKIWRELIKIPYGKTVSYGMIAKKIKTSPRYVGNVCGQNKYLIAVPCHRVIRSDGKLGGFSAPDGINIKKKLLNLEKSNL